MSKSSAATAEIRNNIITGKYPNGKLPGERALASLLKIGRCTVRTALYNLENEGLLERREKSGTFVKIKSLPGNKGVIGLFARTEGHFYKDLYKAMLSAFTAAGYSVQSFSTDYFDTGKNNKSLELHMKNKITELFESPLSAIVMDGYCHSLIPRKKELMAHSPIIYNFYDSSDCRNPPGVWFDFKAIGYMAGKYLISRGCRRPLFISHYIPLTGRLNSNFYPHHKEKRLIEGFSKAVKEAGLPPECCIFDSFSASLKDYYTAIETFFRNETYLPDGICGSSDNLTVKCLDIICDNHGRLPKNLLFMGIGNTPWSQKNKYHPFTTIDLNPDGVAQAILKQIRLPLPKRRNIFIKPILIEYSNQLVSENNQI